MNDRALRNVVLGLGRQVDGVPRQDRFDITAASEIMAIVALASELRGSRGAARARGRGSSTSRRAHHRGRRGRRGRDDGAPPRRAPPEPGADRRGRPGARARRALRQHRARVQLGPRDAARRSRSGDYAITEAGFGFDLGGEKFLDIKCRAAGHLAARAGAGGHAARAQDARRRAGEDERRAERGARSSAASRTSRSTSRRRRFFGLPAVVAINVFPNDTAEELRLRRARRRAGAARAPCAARASPAAARARSSSRAPSSRSPTRPTPRRRRPRYVYELDRPAPREGPQDRDQAIYGADGVAFAGTAEKDMKRIEELGYGAAPRVHGQDAALAHRRSPRSPAGPRGFTVTVREVRLSRGRRLRGAAHRRHDDDARPPARARGPRVKLLANGQHPRA